jgi:septal ring factor EnvC (AmiA/AmiB activator)
LRATLEIISGLRTVVSEERAAAVRELKIAEADWAVLQKSAKGHDASATIKAAVDGVDGAIDRLRKDVAAAEKKVEAADGRFSKSRATLATLEKAHRDAHEALQSLPNQIRAARGQVVRLLGDAKSAAPDDALRIVSTERDIRSALDALRAHTRGSADEDLANELLDTKEVEAARATNAKDQEDLDKAKKDLAELKSTLQVRLQQRESDIRGRVLKHNAKART